MSTLGISWCYARPVERSTSPSTGPRFYEALGRAIKVLRTERGLSRRDLAERSGVSYPYLSEIENGKKRASSKALLSIADALGVRPSELMGTAEPWAEAPDAPDAPERTFASSQPERLRSPDDPLVRPPAEPSAQEAGSTARSPRWFRLARLSSLAGSVPAPRQPADPPDHEPDVLPQGDTTVPGDPLDHAWGVLTPVKLQELHRLLSELAPEDLERALDLVRRLAR